MIPETRQFLSKDLAKADGEESAYQYCGGEPVGRTDLSGHISVYPSHIHRWRVYWARHWSQWKVEMLGVDGFLDAVAAAGIA